MKTINCQCQQLCCYEFEVIGLYINFNDRTQLDVRYALDKFRKNTGVDFSQITLAYHYWNYEDCQKYGLHREYDNLKYLNSLGQSYFNFYTDLMDENEGYIRMYNFIHSYRSIALFYGELTPRFQQEYQEYSVCQKIPIIHLRPNDYCKVIWVGIPDKHYELLYGDEDFKKLN